MDTDPFLFLGIDWTLVLMDTIVQYYLDIGVQYQLYIGINWCIGLSWGLKFSLVLPKISSQIPS